ncbi:MAG: hypothetical protein ABWY20_19435, partial [Mycobacterium sp.]
MFTPLLSWAVRSGVLDIQCAVNDGNPLQALLFAARICRERRVHRQRSDGFPSPTASRARVQMSSELAPIGDTSQQALKMVAIGSDNDAVIRDAGYQSLNPPS